MTTTLQIVGTLLFALAVIHTFLVKKFENIAHKYPEVQLVKISFIF